MAAAASRKVKGVVPVCRCEHADDQPSTEKDVAVFISDLRFMPRSECDKCHRPKIAVPMVRPPGWDFSITKPLYDSIMLLKRRDHFDPETQWNLCMGRAKDADLAGADLDGALQLFQVCMEYSLLTPSLPLARSSDPSTSVAVAAHDVAAPGLRRCKFCHDYSATLQRCGRCHCALYCCKDHQRADWPTHKQQCKPQ